MYFDDDFIESLPEDIPSAIAEICKRYSEIRQRLPSAQDKHLFVTEAFGLIAAYSEANSLGIDVPKIVGEQNADGKNASQFFTKLRSQSSQQMGQNQLEQYKNIFTARLGKVFHYEFSEGDLKRIQDLINELRDLISASEDLEAKHKRRILNKLNKLQSEIHKSVSDLDTLYGSVIELSVLARIVGENLKPVVDRIRELMSIVWPTQARAFGLPSNAPFELPGQTKDDKSKNDKS